MSRAPEIEAAIDAIAKYLNIRNFDLTQPMLEAVVMSIAPLIRSAALEEAAKVADERAVQCEAGFARHGQFFRPDPVREAQDIASSIRALKDKPDESYQMPAAGEIV